MSPAEHAIENAIFATAKGESYEQWVKKESELNLPRCKATANEIWLMAQHVCFTMFSDETFHELRNNIAEY